MPLLLIRHGETALNVARVFQPADTPLNARGLQQAQALARSLTGMHIAAIVASDLPRAWQTADAIRAAVGAPLTSDELLRERNFGDWRGQSHDALPTDAVSMAAAPPGGESKAEFEARVARAFAFIVARAAATEGTLAVVTHGLVVGAMLASHIALPPGVALPAHIGNTSLSVFDALPPHLASLVNSTRHLDAATGDDAKALSGG